MVIFGFFRNGVLLFGFFLVFLPFAGRETSDGLEAVLQIIAMAETAGVSYGFELIVFVLYQHTLGFLDAELREPHAECLSLIHRKVKDELAFRNAQFSGKVGAVHIGLAVALRLAPAFDGGANLLALLFGKGGGWRTGIFSNLFFRIGLNLIVV